MYHYVVWSGPGTVMALGVGAGFTEAFFLGSGQRFNVIKYLEKTFLS